MTYFLSNRKLTVPLTVKNSGLKTVYLSFRTFDFVRNIFTVRDSHGNSIKTIRKHTLGPGTKMTHNHKPPSVSCEFLLDIDK